MTGWTPHFRIDECLAAGFAEERDAETWPQDYIGLSGRLFLIRVVHKVDLSTLAGNPEAVCPIFGPFIVSFLSEQRIAGRFFGVL